ncbi:hypothetical protein HDU67_010288, partial [Dinochytrium kinnereticum]
MAGGLGTRGGMGTDHARGSGGASHDRSIHRDRDPATDLSSKSPTWPFADAGAVSASRGTSASGRAMSTVPGSYGGYGTLMALFTRGGGTRLYSRGVVDGRDLAFWEGWGCTLQDAKTRLVHLVRLVQRLFYERIWVPRCQATAEFWEEEARAEEDWENFMDDLIGLPTWTGGTSEDPGGPTPRLA